MRSEKLTAMRAQRAAARKFSSSAKAKRQLIMKMCCQHPPSLFSSPSSGRGKVRAGEFRAFPTLDCRAFSVLANDGTAWSGGRGC